MIDAHCLFLLLGSSSYPRLYIPNQIPRQTESNTSPATLLLDGKSHEIVLDGTPDGTSYISFPSNTLICNADLAIFAEHASASIRDLKSVLDELEHL